MVRKQVKGQLFYYDYYYYLSYSNACSLTWVHFFLKVVNTLVSIFLMAD